MTGPFATEPPAREGEGDGAGTTEEVVVAPAPDPVVAAHPTGPVGEQTQGPFDVVPPPDPVESLPVEARAEPPPQPLPAGPAASSEVTPEVVHDDAMTAEVAVPDATPTPADQRDLLPPEPASAATPPPTTSVAAPAPEPPVPAEPVQAEVPTPVEPEPVEPEPVEPEPVEPEPVVPVEPEPVVPDPVRAGAAVRQPLAADPSGSAADLPADATPRRAGLLLLVLVGLLTTLMVAGVAFLGLRLRSEARTETARGEAAVASRDAARLLFSYDHTTLEDDFAKGLSVTTGDFRDEYSRTTTQVVTDVARQYKAVVVATVVESAVVAASPDEVTVLVFLNQATTSTQIQGRQVDQSRVRMRLVQKEGRWLVAEVRAL